MTEVARDFRKEPTPSEQLLWQALRNRQVDGRKFRRQQPIGPFVVDFFCGAERLIVEVDGPIHEQQRQQDEQRQELLESLGLRFLRVSANEVEADLEGVVEEIRQAINAPAPLSRLGRGEQEGGSAPLSHPGRGAGGVEATAASRRVGELLPGEAFPHPPNPLLPSREKGGQEVPTSIRHLKLLDPACGSGHFLIIAFDLLFAFYQEEARHRGETWDDRDIVESILAHNLHGLDLDPRAVQIAAAALYLKAKALCPQAELSVLNLVAANLNLAALPEDDPALVELRQAVTASTGIPEELTNQIVQGLKGADAWGSLLKVDDAVDGAIASYERQLWKQGELFASNSDSNSPLLPGRGAGGVDATAASRRVGGLLPGEDRPHPLTPSPKTGEGGQENIPAPLSLPGRGAGGEGTGVSGPHPLTPSPKAGEGGQDSDLPSPSLGEGPGVRASTRDILIAKLERFLTLRTRGDDLGLRLRGEQLAAGVRFLRLVREGAYDLVIGNPPYQGTSKMKDAQYVARHYPKAKADLYAAFLQRGLELAKPGGLSALLTMRNWMFISQYSATREFLIDTYDLRILGDIDRGGFEDVLDEVVSTVMSVFRRADPTKAPSIATQPTPLDDNSRDRYRTNRKRAAVLAQVGRCEFQTQRFDVIKEKPIIYWWDEEFLIHYFEALKIGKTFPVRKGIITGDDTRFNRLPWEVTLASICTSKLDEIFEVPDERCDWAPTIKGAKGRTWLEPLSDIITWKNDGLEIKILHDYQHGSYTKRVQSRGKYFKAGIAFSMIGSSFRGRCGSSGFRVINPANT